MRYCKIVMVGGTAVGKTTLLRALADSDRPVDLTVGCELTKKWMKYDDGEYVAWGSKSRKNR